jgi:hypothetical protein
MLSRPNKQQMKRRRRDTAANACIIGDMESDPPKRQASLDTFFRAVQTSKSQHKRTRVSVGTPEMLSNRLQSNARPEPAACGTARKLEQGTTTSTTSTTHSNNNLEQMYLDLGQRNFATRTECRICGMLFDSHGAPEDLRHHSSVCKDFSLGVSFFQQQAARVVFQSKSASIVEV